MVRQPSLEVISYLKKTDYSKPALRYLFCILQKHTCAAAHRKVNALYLLIPIKAVVVLIRVFRWAEGYWEDDFSLSHGPLLLHTGMAGASYS